MQMKWGHGVWFWTSGVNINVLASPPFIKCEWIASGYWVEESVQNKIQRTKQRGKKISERKTTEEEEFPSG